MCVRVRACVCACLCVCEVQESILFFHLPCSVTFVLAAEHVQDNFSILPAVDSCSVNYTKAAALGGLGWCTVCVCLLGHVNPVQSEVLQVLDWDLDFYCLFTFMFLPNWPAQVAAREDCLKICTLTFREIKLFFHDYMDHKLSTWLVQFIYNGTWWKSAAQNQGRTDNSESWIMNQNYYFVNAQL